MGESDDSPSQGQVEALAGMRLPAGVRKLRARVQQVMTKRTLHLRFDADPAELEATLGATRWAGQLVQGPVPDLLAAAPRPDWFKPEAATTFSLGVAPNAAILVDRPGPSLVTVYLVVRD